MAMDQCHHPPISRLNEKDYSNPLGTEQTGLTLVFVSFLDMMHSGVKGKQKLKTKGLCERQYYINKHLLKLSALFYVGLFE